MGNLNNRTNENDVNILNNSTMSQGQRDGPQTQVKNQMLLQQKGANGQNMQSNTDSLKQTTAKESRSHS